jgi:inosine/xanthosine triphosphatase
MSSIQIVAGTTNPAKIKAVSIAFSKLYPDRHHDIIPTKVDSGVSAQPMSSQESITGATNRAARALKQVGSATYGVGLEGGLEEINGEWFDCGWCVIVDRHGIQGVASSARIITPPAIMKLIEQGQELGDAIDNVFNRENSKQAEGHFGLMTNNAVTRTDGYVHAVCLAFTRFLHPKLF